MRNNISGKIVPRFQDSRGLSLLEVLVALTIMVLITSVGMASWVNSLRRSRDARRQTDLELVRGALEIYRADENEYPNGAVDYAAMITTLQGPPVYINTNPQDPRAGTWDYFYASAAPGATYQLCAFLEGPVVTSPCVVGGTESCTSNICNYCVCNP